MLISLSCKKLIRENLIFTPGLNSVLGPNNGANSIGKSSVLLLIDFVFGGNDFINLCADAIDNVGHITVDFSYQFDEKTYSFSRSTITPDIVLFKNGKSENKELNEFKVFLREKYNFDNHAPNFRNMIGRFSRVWGKDNYNPNKPLHIVPSESFSSIKSFLIQSFGFAGLLNETERLQEENNKKKKSLDLAFKEGFIRKITLREAEKLRVELSEVNEKIKFIRENLEVYATNINEIINNKSLGLKVKKDSVLKEKNILLTQLSRISRNLELSDPVKEKYFEKVEEFIPNVNINRLREVEKFHSSISKILQKELKAEKFFLETQLNEVDILLSSLDAEIKKVTGVVDKPSELVDEILSLSIKQKEIKSTIEYRELQDNLTKGLKDIRNELKIQTEGILDKIEKILNDGVNKYISIFYPDNRISPKITLSNTNYIFDHYGDSGTGKSYANMLALDLTFLDRTSLPILIEDSIVFKNIELSAIQEIIKCYSISKKQIFISIDQIGNFNSETQSILRHSKFIRLNEKLLAFKKSWKINN
ncbi:DUF2326 domain-containing protein [Yersinia enterocolitica]|uniref:DUF2326 domain-containing protein n=1 Tax=Yersinia enterocolitica TaxID=630 RepID=UPI00398D0C4A